MCVNGDGGDTFAYERNSHIPWDVLSYELRDELLSESASIKCHENSSIGKSLCV